MYEVNAEQIPAAEAVLPPGLRVLPFALGDGRPATFHVTFYR